MMASKDKIKFFRARVINAQDPKKKGRVEVEWIISQAHPPITMWAYPANNACGGRNPEDGQPYGEMKPLVPGTYTIIYFENGALNKPRYLHAMDIDFGDNLPENEVGEEYWRKWTLFRSPEGRTIIMSDDPSDCRTEITGKKRKPLDLEKKEEQVYDITDNQSTILMDERKGKEKILIKDYKGNFININTEDDNIETSVNNDLIVFIGNDVFQTVAGNIKSIITGNISLELDNGDLHLKGDGRVYLDGNLKVTVSENANIYINGNLNLLTDGNTNITSNGGECNITTRNTHIEGNVSTKKLSVNGGLEVSGNANIAGSCSFGASASPRPTKPATEAERIERESIEIDPETVTKPDGSRDKIDGGE